MKKIYVLALSALLVAAFSGAAMAKVNLSGAIWVTYWAQQEGGLTHQTLAGADVPQITQVSGQAVIGNQTGMPAKKTFILAQSMTGDGVQNKRVAGDGFLLALDCPVNDWVKAYAEVDVMPGSQTYTNALYLQQGYINLAFMKELNVRAGLMQVPFGLEATTRPTVGREEVFVSDYTQQASGLLQEQYDAGVQVYGALASGMVDYSLFVGNGALNTVTDNQGNDSDGVVAWDNVLANASNVTPDNNDAKQVGVNLCFKPFTGAFVGGGYFAGDYAVNRVRGAGVNAVNITNAKFTAYDVNAGYEYGNIFAISGEYATSRFDRKAADLANVANSVSQRTNEYILKAIYTGVADWEFGVRYGVVDPKNLEAEVAAGFTNERKVSFAAGYKFARAAFLKAEYSIVNTDFNYVQNPTVAALGTVRQNPTKDVADNIAALSLGLQF